MADTSQIKRIIVIDQKSWSYVESQIRQETIAEENKYKLFHTTVLPSGACVIVNDVAVAGVVSVVVKENIVVGVVELVVAVTVAVAVDGVAVVVISVVTTGDVVVVSSLTGCCCCSGCRYCS